MRPGTLTLFQAPRCFSSRQAQHGGEDDRESWSPGKQQVLYERWATTGRVHPRNDHLLVHMTTELVFNW